MVLNSMHLVGLGEMQIELLMHLLLLIGLVSIVISFPPLILRELRKDVCGLFV